MKMLIRSGIFALAGLLGSANAQPQFAGTGHLLGIQYSGPPVPVMTTCNVNGVDYQIDFNYRIWGLAGYGQWMVLGEIVRTPTGPVAVRNDGATFPALCR
jgi:hypothetical protein